MVNYTHTVAFRVSGAQYQRLIGLRATFEEPQFGHALRWLLEQPEVQDVIDRRERSGMIDAYRPVGIEASLPAGDR